MLFLKKIFFPSEVKLCFKILDDLDRQLNSMMFYEVKDRVEKVLSNVERTSYLILQERMLPEKVVLMLCLTTLGNLIGCGSYHSYRNRLSYKGDDLLRCWNRCSAIMLEKAYYSKEEYDNDQKWIHEQISNAG